MILHDIEVPDPWDGQPVLFSIPTMELWSPGVLHLECIAFAIDGGASLTDAYTQCSMAGIGDVRYMIPHPDLRPCCSDVFQTVWFDPNAWESKHTSGLFIVKGLANCLEMYKQGEWDTKAGRLKIAPGVYTPSATEEACIRNTYRMGENLRQAYIDCACRDIIPNWSVAGTPFVSALEVVEKLVRTNPNQHLYFSTKAAWYLCQTSPHEPHHEPHHQPHHLPPKKTDNTWLYVGAGVAVLLLLYRR